MICLRLSIMEYRGTEMHKKRHSGQKDGRYSAGSITLEAAIFLSIFIMFYVWMMDLIQIAKAQVILQYSINEVAKEVSAYGYVLTKAGIVDKRLSTAEKSGEVTQIIDALENVGEILESGQGDLQGAVQDAGEKIKVVTDKADSSSDYLDYAVSVIKTAGADAASDWVIGQIVEHEVEKQLKMATSKDPNTYLRKLGIRDGLAGLNCSKSSWCNKSADGMPELEIIVEYEIDFNLGYLELQPRTYTLCAKTALW